MKKFKLMAEVNERGTVDVKRDFEDSFNNFEIVGIYEFMKNKYKGINAGAVVLFVAIEDRKLIIRSKSFIGEKSFNVESLFEKLIKEELDNIKKSFEVIKNE